jgi:ABC-2 type transport system permease protein
MLANVFTKTLRDRQLGILIGSVLTVLVAVFGLAVYSDLDEVLADYVSAMPEAWLSVMGLTRAADAGSLIIGQTFNLIAPMVFAGLAISMGSSAIAGEERRGTMGILLGNPLSRQGVVISNAGALTLLVLVGSALVWAGTYLTALLFDTDLSNINLGAATLHLAAISLFFGFLALLVGSWTGNGGAASGVSTTVLLVSFVAAGLLPLIGGWEELARVFPWFYFNSSQPLQNGVDWGDVSVLVGLVALFGGLSLAGVSRRDLRMGGVEATIFDKLRRHPLTRRVADRVAGSARVSRIGAKTLSDHQGLAVVAGAVVFYIALLIGPFFNALSDVLVELSASFPDALLAMVGFADMGTPEGWYQTEVFSFTVPAAFITVTAIMGAKALAGEEEDHTMDLLLANPMRRRLVVTEKTFAMTVISLGLGVVTFAGSAAGSLIGGLGMDLGNLAAASFHASILAIVFGCLAFAISGGTGRRRTASFATAGIALLAYFANAFLLVNENLAGWAKLSPFYYFLSSDPLMNGVDWGHVGVLAALSMALFAAAIGLFQRRDLRG